MRVIVIAGDMQGVQSGIFNAICASSTRRREGGGGGMSAHSLEARLSEYDARLSFFDAKLKPIGSRPIKTQANLEELKKRPHPLDEAGIRTVAENVLAAVIELYASTPEAREPIREMFTRYRMANWALWPSQDPTSEDGFRMWLLRISIDYKEDPRDVLNKLWHICCEAEDAGVNIQPILESVAAISSDADPYGWGSMQKMLLKAAAGCRTKSWPMGGG
jgi:hypothetical protein